MILDRFSGDKMPIFKSGNRYKIENTKGSSPTKEAANKRLRAIKANQAKRKKLGKI